MSDFLTAQPNPPMGTLLSALTEQAATLATAQAQNALLEQTGDPIRWRTASLVWPLFTSSLMKTASPKKKG